MYEYQAIGPITVIDGDTMDVTLDLGFKILFTQRIRLARIDAKELKKPGGFEARDFVVVWLEDNARRPILVRTEKVKYDQYHRYIAEVIRSWDGRNLNDDLVTNGHAVYKTYREVEG